VCALACASPALADPPAQPAPDKSAYSLLDPTPADQERAFCTDRPTKSTGACTVDAGHFQYETDLVNYTYDHEGGVTTQTLIAPDPTLKLGLTNTLDAELSIAPFQMVTMREHGRSVTQTGIGDLYLRLKLALAGDDGGSFAAALVPYVKAPTASAGLGNGAVEGGLIAPLIFTLPDDWSLTVDPEADVLEDSAARGEHLNVSGLLSFSRPVSKTLTFSVEAWGDVNFEPTGTIRQVSFDLGLAWIPPSHPNVQLDGGVNIGLDPQTPAAQAYVGLSQRF
jgi:hypothetical protein